MKLPLLSAPLLAAFLLLTSSAWAAPVGSLSLSSAGSGAKVGEAQSLTAQVMNTGSEAFVPRACVTFNASYISLDTSSGPEACFSWPGSLSPGSSSTVTWLFKGKKAVNNGSFSVKLYRSGSSTALATASQAYKVLALGPRLALSSVTPAPGVPLELWQGRPHNLQLKLENTGDQPTGPLWLCLQKPAGFTVSPYGLLTFSSFPGSSDFCYKRSSLSASLLSYKPRLLFDFVLQAGPPTSGQLELRAGYGSTSNAQAVASLSVPYLISGAQVELRVGALRRKGRNLSRRLTVVNSGTQTQALQVCAEMSRGRLVSLHPKVAVPEGLRCADLGSPAAGRSSSAVLTVRGSRPRANLQVRLADDFTTVLLSRSLAF